MKYRTFLTSELGLKGEEYPRESTKVDELEITVPEVSIHWKL